MHSATAHDLEPDAPPLPRPRAKNSPAACSLFIYGSVMSHVQAFQPRPQPCFRCPFDWIGYRGKCYYFSEAEGNWTSSQDNCSALGASLAMLDSMEDLSFVIRYKGISEHWIGLSREDEEQPWRWVNHSHLSRLFRIHGGGLCAYLNNNGLSSSRCSTERSWVCNKLELQSPSKGNGMRWAQNLCFSS
ncbi:C-type lectin domain family 2 member B-like isoform X3 [Accipiter gentilis]|uniref:C-type lectin domain family 2 member B-like isoform X3 n=1 Tax=Astur gentilis TaxID=8957 RepID=UPI00211010A5|nr:C-type lectin domain family 2 member B-like isoform X3 [Accipiter gentilis]